MSYCLPTFFISHKLFEKNLYFQLSDDITTTTNNNKKNDNNINNNNNNNIHSWIILRKTAYIHYYVMLTLLCSNVQCFTAQQHC